MKKLIFCGILCFVVLLLVADEAKKYDLVSKLKKGDSFTKSVKVEMESSMETEMGKQEMSMGLQVNGDMSVGDVDEKGTVTAMDKVTRVVSKIKGMGMEVEYDSDKKQEEGKESDPLSMTRAQIAQRYGRYVNKTFKTKISKQWTVEIPEDGKEMEKDMLLGYLEGMAQLPDHPVCVGDVWEVNIKRELGGSAEGGSLEMVVSLTLKEVKDSTAIIEGKFKSAKVPEGEVELEKSSYTLHFNIEKGYPESEALSLSLVGKEKSLEGEDVSVMVVLKRKCEFKSKEEPKEEPKKEEQK